MKNNENYEMNLATNKIMGPSSAQRDFYTQSQRSSIQNPMELNPDQFNNLNIKSSKLNEITNSNSGISQEKLKDVNIYFIQFFKRQTRILEEMNLIKDDLQFILENKSKSKLKERLETSLNNSAFNESNCLNSSIASSLSKGRIKTKYNLTEKIDNKNLTKFQEFLSTYNQNKNVLLLVDSKNNIWEFVRRPDLSIASLSTNENITT